MDSYSITVTFDQTILQKHELLWSCLRFAPFTVIQAKAFPFTLVSAMSWIIAYPKWAGTQMTDNQAGSAQEDAVALAERLRQTLGSFVRAIRLQADTPTTSQSETLALLDSNGPSSVAELASFRNVKHQSMRLVINQLEGNGLVGRLPNPADGRSHLLSITAKGRDQLSQSREARTSKIASLIEERLSVQERETLQAAIAIIERLS